MSPRTLKHTFYRFMFERMNIMRFISRRQLFAAFLTATLLVGTAVSASARAIDRVVAFGDSLTDDGNLSDDAALFGFNYPAAPYDPNSLSNGDVWVEGFASSLGATLDNRAYAGAYTDNRNTVDPFLTANFLPPFGQGIQEQVAGYLGAPGVVNPDNLYVLWGGANDLFNDAALLFVNPVAAAQPAQNIAGYVNALIGIGGTQFLVPNLPNLGDTPGGVASGFGAELNALTAFHNATLSGLLANISLANPTVSIKILDVNSLFVAAIANPGAFGFTNVVDPYVINPNGQAGTFPVPVGVGDPAGYLFWDEIHPTASTHSLIAQQALATVVPEVGTAGLMGAGCSLFGAGIVLRRRRKA